MKKTKLTKLNLVLQKDCKIDRSLARLIKKNRLKVNIIRDERTIIKEYYKQLQYQRKWTNFLKNAIDKRRIKILFG